MDYFFQLTITGLLIGAVYGLVALGIVVIYKATSVFNLAQGYFVAFTAFVCWFFLVQLHLPFVLSIIGLIMVSLIMALMIERFTMRPLIGQPVIVALMVCLALAEILAGLVGMMWPGPGRMYPSVIPSGAVHTGILPLSLESLINFGVCMLAFGIFLVFFQRTKMGLAMRATAEDHQLAQSGGISVTTIFAMSWFIAILMASVGGVLLGSLCTIDLDTLSSIGLKAFPAVILGGLGSIVGAIVGGFIVGLLESVGGGYLDPLVGGGAADVIPFIILVLVLLIKPDGLFGYKRIERV